MFAEIRWQQYNITDYPVWKDPTIFQYDSTQNRFIILNPSYVPVGQNNTFKLNYFSLIIGPRFELLKHVGYEIGTSLDILVSEKINYANFENNPYLKWKSPRWAILQEANIHFYNRI